MEPSKNPDQITGTGNDDMKNCGHSTLMKVEQSGINEVDTDVLIYACSKCGKPFTITDS
jgi:hypothetical protein